MLGFSYFVNRDIAFGLCFFYLLNTVQQGIFNVLGVQKIDPVLGAYSTYTVRSSSPGIRGCHRAGSLRPVERP